MYSKFLNHNEPLEQTKTNELCSGPEVIKLFSCSTQLSMKFKLLINAEIAQIN